MGTSRTVGEFVAKLDRAARNVDTFTKNGVKAAAVIVTKSVDEELNAAGVHGKLSRVRSGKGAAVTVGFAVKTGVTSYAIVKMRGPAQLVENDTKPHAIPKEGARVRRSRKRLVLVDGNVRARVAKHPGTKGKHPFRKGVDRSLPAAEVAFTVGARAAIRKAFS